MSELPPDLPRLHAIETYLRLQLEAVRARITELETGQPAWCVGPATAWKLQLFPTPEDRPQRGTLHREECWMEGVPVDRDRAVAVLGMPDVDACEACHPERGLRGAAPDPR